MEKLPSDSWRRYTPDQMREARHAFNECIEEWLEGASRETVRGMAIMVVVAAILVGPHPTRIVELTRIRLSRVICFAAEMYDNGLWLADGKLAISTDAEDQDALYIEMVLHALCAEGAVVHVREPRQDRICIDCGGPRDKYAGKRCRSCYRARSALLHS